MQDNLITNSASSKIMVLFGTRPEAIKLAPVIGELKKRSGIETLVVSSSQHTDLLRPFLKLFDISVDHNLKVMSKNQTPNTVGGKVLDKVDRILEAEKPALIIVQGDTTTAFAGAFAGFNRKIPVAHVEAGLRSGNPLSPFPEEMNRRLISKLATYHFAATEKNRQELIREGVKTDHVFVTGNPIVDSLHSILRTSTPSQEINRVIENSKGLKRIVLTTHRRESFGETMGGNLESLRDFVKKRKDTCLIFPVHPNPNVKAVTNSILADQERIFLLDPLDYVDFVTLMKKAWLIVSDSGGIQEEAPSLGKPLLILRENTERPEVLESRVAKLVGNNPRRLGILLEENYAIETWIQSVKRVQNPFGDGTAGRKIVDLICKNRLFNGK